MNRTIADLIQERFGLPTEAGRAHPADGALALLLSHRTQRRYKPDPMHVTPKENQRFVERFGHSEPYGWSVDKARQYSVPERHNFGPFIRRHGFGLV